MIRFLQIQTFVALVVLPLFTSAQKPVITTGINRNDILIGQQIEMRVQVKMPDNLYRLTWFTQPEDFGTFVVAHTGKIDTAYSNGILTFSQRMLITSFDSGKQIVPPLEFNFDLLQMDSSFRMYTDSIPINVTYSAADSVLPFHDIKTIIPVSKMDEWWFWPVIIAALILLIFLIIYFIKSKKKAHLAIAENTLSPYEEAVNSLDDLKAKQLVEKGRYNFFFTALTDVPKRFLSRTQDINLMALTGTELITAIKDKVPRETLTQVASCIKMGEAAKFAKYQPFQKDCMDSLDEIRKLIDILHTNTKIPEDDK